MYALAVRGVGEDVAPPQTAIVPAPVAAPSTNPYAPTPESIAASRARFIAAQRAGVAAATPAPARLRPEALSVIAVVVAYDLILGIAGAILAGRVAPPGSSKWGYRIAGALVTPPTMGLGLLPIAFVASRKQKATG